MTMAAAEVAAMPARETVTLTRTALEDSGVSAEKSSRRSQVVALMAMASMVSVFRGVVIDGHAVVSVSGLM